MDFSFRDGEGDDAAGGGHGKLGKAAAAENLCIFRLTLVSWKHHAAKIVTFALGNGLRRFHVRPKLVQGLTLFPAVVMGEGMAGNFLARDGSDFLTARKEEKELLPIPEKKLHTYGEEIALSCDKIWFRYEKDLPDVVKGLSLKLHKGEFYV